ncbi:magnesium transporter [Tropicimonas sp. IMCC34043]|uniref:magnesium transporter n=1 Tax=Tropicimonas sp. IMCC34043 TaxID=2248760 RepID=UPI000E26D274|nr:magnesium transporter [Tropicimonas sp. IMCC34043]
MIETDAPPLWDATEGENADAANAAATKAISAMIKAGERRRVLTVLDRWQPTDILALFMRLRSKHARRLLEWLPDEAGIGILSELDPRLRALLVEEKTKAKFRKLIGNLDQDRALALLEGLPHDYALDIVTGDPNEAALREALETDDDMAAAHMLRGILTAREDGTVGEVIAEIRARSDQIDRLERVYVIDAQQTLKGCVRLRDLLLNDDDTPIAQVMEQNAVVVTAETDQEDVLALAKKKRIHNIAVVDAAGRLIGGITPRGLRRIAREEAEEDMLLMGGVSPDATAFDRPLQIVRRRLPWILGGLIGSSIAATVIGSYEQALAEAAILASFIPVVMSTAGNVGIQASTMSIQAIGNGMSLRGDFLPRLGREMLAAVMNGLLVGSVVGALVLLASMLFPIPSPLYLALTCLFAILLVTILAATLGTLVPFVLKALKFDPAVATGIFITTTNDVFGVLVFFTVASVFYL